MKTFSFTAEDEQRSVKMAQISSGVLNEEFDEGPVSLDSLAGLTGFPVEFIKRELLISGESISMSNFRKIVIDYLECSIDNIRED